MIVKRRRLGRRQPRRGIHLIVRHADESDVERQVEAGVDQAKALHLAPGTVKVHVSAILRKTEARNRVEAALIALRAGRA